MATNSALAKSVLRGIQENLQALLFCKKRGEGFYRELGKDTDGYVGLNLATRLPNNSIGISPIVGVSYAPIEDRIQKLCTTSPFLNDATLTTAVGYLTPEKRFLQWVFDPALGDTMGSEIAKIARSIEQYGLPFMQEHTSLESIITELEATRYTVNDLRRYRLPVAYLLAGKRDEALKLLGQELEAMNERTDPAALQYRDFAQAVREG
jgi:hypothetical protein